MIMQLNNLCGIDIGCTNIKMAAIVDGIVYKRIIPSGDNLSQDSLIQAITTFYRSFNYDFDGLGIAFSGCTTNGYNIYHTTLPCLDNLTAKDFYHLTKNVLLINDSNATALAGLLEYPNAKVLLGITNGTGIGLGITINGKLFTGGNGLAGEIYGNPTFDFSTNPTKVGKLCSGSKILKMKNSTSTDTDVITIASHYMGSVLVSLIHVFNPNILYFSGGGFNFPNYLDLTKEFIRQNTYSYFLNNLVMASSRFDSFSGCFGAMKFIKKSC